jgi:hypothetical protein
MSKRLQVLLDESELREIREVARQNHLSVAEWVRQVLRIARQGQSRIDPASKLDATRKAARHRFPAPDIEQMLEEIERGYSSETRS